MLTLPSRRDGVSLVAHVASHISAGAMPDYVYSYPPRQAFRPLGELVENETFTLNAIASAPTNFNLYLHFPFCRQICGFCNLFAVAGSLEASIHQYLTTISEELRSYSRALPALHARTLYLGGGTPSLLSARQIQSVLNEVENCFPGAWTKTEELCIEVAPDTLDKEKCRALVSLGFTRVSLGAQTLDENELATVGRRYLTAITRNAADLALHSGIRDVCIDLINGLPGQTRQSWTSSVKEIIALRPPTVCTYNLTSRPATAFHSLGLGPPQAAERYFRYKIAQDLLLAAGYEQETNVRYVIPGVGGYKQKVRHWAGGTILGIGAGARTYTPTLHYHNGYSARRRREVLLAYIHNVANSGHSREEGIILDEDERIRQQLILTCHNLPVGALRSNQNSEYEEISELFDWLISTGHAELRDGRIQFSPRGFVYRDVIAHALFSERVRQLVIEHDYCA